MVNCCVDFSYYLALHFYDAYSMVMSQVTLQNLRIHHMGNPQFIRRIVNGYPQNCQRVSTNL